MTELNAIPGTAFETEEENFEDIYGEEDEAIDDQATLNRFHRRDYSPWHHPVKQIVRSHQWAALTERFIQARPQANASDALTYFTLPGADLFDVQTLSNICEPLGVKIQYFGFNSAFPDEEAEGANDPSDAPWVTAESALRQAGRITSDAVVLSDRLEDIANTASQASLELGKRPPFDIINIDACDHLAYSPKGRPQSMFDALQHLLSHQLRAKSPWLLFITTRVQPDLIGAPGAHFQQAINENLSISNSGFGAALAECLSLDEDRFTEDLLSCWDIHDERFLKLYTVGLGKYLLQFFHGQPSLPANVELASVYSYRVYGEQADMLALAFRVTPDPLRVFLPMTGGSFVIPDLEPRRATKVARQAIKIQDLDKAIAEDEEIRQKAISGTVKLLEGARFDINGWCEWLAKHSQRPLVVSL